MILDTFERYKNNLYLSPITADTLQTLGERCGLSPASQVLDVFCGSGGAAITLAEKFGCMVTGTESRLEFAEEARRRAIFGDLQLLVSVVDIEPGELPFDDAYFDLAMSIGFPYPYNSEEMVHKLARVVRPGGWIALSELVWKPGASQNASDAVRGWLGGFAPAEIADMNDRKTQFRKEGFQVEWTELEKDASWESYYAPQARSIMENRSEYRNSSDALSTLNQWQNELELYHSGGGRESLGYACFLLRRP
jgi:ubiquinone/menaquinone biosynthesis C-methylase UbiE